MAEEYMANNTGSKTLMGIMFGALAGLTAGLLLAPKSGRETRDQIKATARDTKEKLRKTAAELKGKAKDSVDTAMDKAKSVTRRAESELPDAI